MSRDSHVQPAPPPAAPDLQRGSDWRSATQNAGRRLNQANRGLRMILTAGVFAILITSAAAVATAYIELRKVEALAATDQDALRVMCATNPPGRDAYGWQRICELAAEGRVLEASETAIDGEG